MASALVSALLLLFALAYVSEAHTLHTSSDDQFTAVQFGDLVSDEDMADHMWMDADASEAATPGMPPKHAWYGKVPFCHGRVWVSIMPQNKVKKGSCPASSVANTGCGFSACTTILKDQPWYKWPKKELDGDETTMSSVSGRLLYQQNGKHQHKKKETKQEKKEDKKKHEMKKDEKKKEEKMKEEKKHSEKKKEEMKKDEKKKEEKKHKWHRHHSSSLATEAAVAAAPSHHHHIYRKHGPSAAPGPAPGSGHYHKLPKPKCSSNWKVKQYEVSLFEFPGKKEGSFMKMSYWPHERPCAWVPSGTGNRVLVCVKCPMPPTKRPPVLKKYEIPAFSLTDHGDDPAQWELMKTLAQVDPDFLPLSAEPKVVPAVG